ncbi:MAG: hypothetical protein Q4F67_07120 [Propionibacteriaceae bacterium]|nr:hypothetical protein [Propionibacteriaceae bacterium]
MLIVDDLDVQEFAEEAGDRWISLQLPTHRSGPESTSGSIMLKNLIRDAAAQVDDTDQERLEESVGPLVDDSQFWRFQAEGLAIFVSPEATRVHRVSIPLAPIARAGDTPHLVPLAPILGRVTDASILQLSLGAVRLFQVRGEVIEEAELGPIPASVDELQVDRDHQTQLQFTSQGGGAVSFHGHGADGSVDRTRRDRFLRHVARGLEERESQRRTHGPLFLAATQDMAELFIRLSGRSDLSDRLIPGSADGVRPAEVLERARPVLDAYGERRLADHRETLGQRRSQGRVLDGDPAQVLEAATHGRVDTLYVGEVDEADFDTVNQAILATLGNSGEVLPAPDDDIRGVVATLRF